MNKTLALALVVSFAAQLTFAQSAAGDYLLDQKQATGPAVIRRLTPVVGRLMGWASSIDAPSSIALGSGLTLSGNTLSATASGGTWGTITGTLSAQTDLQTALNARQPLNASLTSISGLSPSNGESIRWFNGQWTRSDPLFEPNFTNQITVTGLGPSIGMNVTGGGFWVLTQPGDWGGGSFFVAPAKASGFLAVTDQANGLVNLANGVTGILASGSLPTSGVTAGSYTSASLTVDATGRVTAISNGSGSLTIGTTAISGGTAGRLLLSGASLTELALGGGVAAFLQAPTLANFNAATPDADAATTAANTYTGSQILERVPMTGTGSTALPSLSILPSSGVTAVTTRNANGTALGIVLPDASQADFYNQIRSNTVLARSTFNGRLVGHETITTGNSGLQVYTTQASAVADGGGIGRSGLFGAVATGARVASNYQYAFSSNSAGAGDAFSIDTGLSRAAAGVVGVTNGATGGGGLEFTEVTAPSGPAANRVRIWVEDNGLGKTRLMVRFGSGAAMQIAIEP